MVYLLSESSRVIYVSFGCSSGNIHECGLLCFNFSKKEIKCGHWNGDMYLWTWESPPDIVSLASSRFLNMLPIPVDMKEPDELGDAP